MKIGRRRWERVVRYLAKVVVLCAALFAVSARAEMVYGAPPLEGDHYTALNPGGLNPTLDSGTYFRTFTIPSIPEPASLILLATGLAFWARRLRRRPANN